MHATWTAERLDDFAKHVDVRFNQVDVRFVEIDGRLAVIDQRFAQVDKRFEQIDKRFEQVDVRFDRLETEIRSVRTDVKRELGYLHVDVKGDLSMLRNSVDALTVTFTRALIAFAVGLLGVLAAALLGG